MDRKPFSKLKKGRNSQNNWWIFTLNQTWPTINDYIPVYKIWSQYTNLYKLLNDNDFSMLKKGCNSKNNWWILA